MAKRFYWLDWLRFVAAFIVLISHARGFNWVRYSDLPVNHKNWWTPAFFLLTHLGFEAVVVFFVLSGFLVGGKVLERVIHDTFEFREYAIDRISRIYVPLLPALFLSAVVGLVCGLPVTARDFFGNLIGLQGIYCRNFADNLPLWSLAYEFWFYLLAGFAALILVRVRVHLGIKVLAMFGVLLTFAIFTQFHAYLLFCWCLGAFSYQLVEPYRYSKKNIRVWFMAGIVLALFGVGFSQFIHAHLDPLGDFWNSASAAILILTVGLTLVLPYLAIQKPQCSAMIAFEYAGTRLAVFSYTLYLTHYQILQFWSKIDPQKFNAMSFHSFVWYFAKCASCLLVSWLFYLPFEAQTQRVRHWMRKSVLYGKIKN